MPIFDQGYQHFSGTLSGHAWRWLTITRHGVRIGMKNIFLRLVVITSWLPAAGLAVMLCLWGLLEQKSSLIQPLLPFLSGIFAPEILADPKQYRDVVWTLSFNYFLGIELTFSMIVVMLVGPGLISQDLRFNALPLYFSRPLRRGDYFIGKLGVIAWFLSMVVILPSLIAYVLGLLFSLDVTILWDTLALLAACLAYGAVIVLSAGTFMLALSSLSRNSRYIALFWVGIWFVSGTVASILEGVEANQRRHRLGERLEKLRRAQRPGKWPQTPEEQRAAQEEQRAAQEAERKSMAEFQAEEIQAARNNWRPLVAYTSNLSRIGQKLLNTEGAWDKVSRLKPPEARDQFLLNNLGNQYPWYWSAGVLAALFGTSTCILNLRVRSLDRLR
jgi:ABC-2 type transport system permease protein